MKKVFLFMAVCLPMLTFTACNNDDDDDVHNELSGAYAYYYQDSFEGIEYKDGHVIWFEKDKCHYSGLTDNTNPSLWADWVRWAPLPGCPGWYFEEDRNHHVYSYVVDGSTIIVSNGDILTKDGNNIYRDGTKYAKL